MFPSEAKELPNILKQTVVNCQGLVSAFDVCYPWNNRYTKMLHGSLCSEWLLPRPNPFCCERHQGCQLLALCWRGPCFSRPSPFLGSACIQWLGVRDRKIQPTLLPWLWRAILLQSSLWDRLRPCCDGIKAQLLPLRRLLLFPLRKGPESSHQRTSCTLSPSPSVFWGTQLAAGVCSPLMTSVQVDANLGLQRWMGHWLSFCSIFPLRQSYYLHYS